MHRRSLLLAAGTLAAPAIARAQSARVLKYTPPAMINILDPVHGATLITRIHSLMVYDTLYGIDDGWVPQPQMAEGHVLEDGAKTWRITLREGLRFHDNTPVLARDVVASLKRWGKRDVMGQGIFDITEELSAPSDRVVLWKLKRPYPMLPEALGKMNNTIAAILPERIANTDAFTAITDFTGSGPFRYVAAERVDGARSVYAKAETYLPRSSGAAQIMAGPKVVHFDRVEWTVMPDPSTAANALAKGEIDWWSAPIADLIPLLKRNSTLKVDVLDRSGSVGVVRFNFLHPPFNKVAVRQAALAAISQRDIMTAVFGTDESLWRTPCGIFPPGTPNASDAGLAALKDPPDLDAARRMLAASGYAGEKVLFNVATEIPTLKNQADVVIDAWKRIGFNVDYVPLATSIIDARLANKGTVAEGGWSAFASSNSGYAAATPVANNFLRANGDKAIFGWPDIPRIEELRAAYVDAPDRAAQAAICRTLQQVCLETLPYIPTGMWLPPTAYRSDLTDVRRGFPQFYGVRRV